MQLVPQQICVRFRLKTRVPHAHIMEMQKINDSLDSLHFRMDRFYAWASQLQVEFRDMKQRIGFIESNINSFESINEVDEEEEEILKRLQAAK